MSHRPIILEIKGNSLDDGPGIRTVVFFKGCPLDCLWCHNPESKRREPELSFDSSVCIGCQTCLKTCQLHALDKQNPFYIDRQRCSLCFECVQTCPAEALTQVGKEMTVAEIMEQVSKDQPFFVTSGGGLTLSGGEPLSQIEFASELLQAAKRQRIHTLVETCGLYSFPAFAEQIAPYCDLIYFDLKLRNSLSHRRYCGVANERIVANLEAVSHLAAAKDFELLVRVPLVPGITATEDNLTGIAGLLKQYRLNRVQLLNYNPLWPLKCAKIGITPQTADQPALQSWLTAEQLRSCSAFFTNHGIEVV